MTSRLLTPLVAIVGSVFVGFSEVRAVTIASETHQQQALERMAKDFGCSPGVLENYFAAIKPASSGLVRKAVSAMASRPVPRERVAARRTTPKPRGVMRPADVEDSTAGRDAYLAELTQRGYEALDAELFGEFHRARMARMLATTNPEALKTVALMSWLEDLTRERLHLLARAAGSQDAFYWWNAAEGVFDIGWYNAADFAYEDGDILLTLRPSSMSYLICASTQPPRRQSHALLARVRDASPVFLEAMMDSGVQAIGRGTLGARSLDHLVIARVRPDVSQRDLIRAKASDLAEARIGTPYNFGMTLDTNDGYFCSSLVALSYADASALVLDQPLAVTNLLPAISRITSPPLQEFLSILGVREWQMPSPGDLVTSPYVDVVAEYRDMDQLFESWLRYINAHSFIDALETGHRVQPHPLEPLFNLVIWMRHRFDVLSFLPKEISGKDISQMATFDRIIYNPTLDAVRKALPPGGHYLCQTAPWTLRALMVETMTSPHHTPGGLKTIAHPVK